MKSGHCLPTEVWLQIFDRIPYKRHLAQCKLVCKAWVPLVERTMLKSLVLFENDATLKLYQYLVQHPESRYVQRICLPPSYKGVAVKFASFLKATMTPTLKIIDGRLDSRADITTLYNMARHAQHNLVKLERLPTSYWLTKSYALLLCHYKETLQSMSIEISENVKHEYLDMIIRNLHQFDSLTHLALVDHNQHLTSVQKLDEILRDCHHLKSLKLHIPPRQSRLQSETNEPDLHGWRTKSVEQVASLKSIDVCYKYSRHIDSSFRSDLVEYLSFKYPNAKTVHIFGHAQDEQRVPCSLFGNANTVHFDRWLFLDTQNLTQTYEAWKSQSNSVSLQYNSLSKLSQGVCKMEIIKSSSSKGDHTQFNVTDVPGMTPLRYVNQLLPLCEEMKIKHLKINLVELEDEGNDAIVDLLKYVSLVETVELICDNGHLGRGDVSPLTRLHTVDMTRVLLKEGDLAYFGSLAPHLKHLKLSACFEHTPYNGKRQMQLLHLPDNRLCTLTLRSKNTIPLPHVTTILSLALNGSSPKLYLCSDPEKPLLEISRQDFETKYHSINGISVECASLKHLSIDTSSLTLELEFDNDGNIIESSPCSVN